MEEGHCSNSSYLAAVVVLSLLLACAAGALAWIAYLYMTLKQKKLYEFHDHNDWKVSYNQLEFANQRKDFPAVQRCDVHRTDITRGCHFSCVTCLAYRRPQPKTADLHALRVVVKKLHMEQQPTPDLMVSEIKALSSVRGSVNVANFHGVVLERGHTCIVMEAGSRGSLRDILNNQNMHGQLNSDFRYSLSRDIARGMDFIHRSDIGVHGNLTSFNCIVDNQWVCKVTDFGLPSLKTDVDKQHLQTELHKMLWVAPELLIVCPPESLVSDVFATSSLLLGDDTQHVSTQDIYPFSNHVILRQNGTKAADVYAYGMILHELLTFNVPYSEYNKPLTLILEQVHGDPTFRPRIPDETKIEFVELIEQCWGNAPSLRPTFPDCLNYLLQYFHVQGKSLVDVMLEQLQRRGMELQAEVNKRTQDMKLEKERFEKILHQIIPEKVTRQLQPGDNSQNNPTEVFDDVTVCFGDIVGFTRIASSLAPIEVADLLNSLYSHFDSILEDHRVYKLGTIGDAYMVASGVPERIGDQHAAECANFALDMMASITGYRFAPFPDIQIQLRVGLHSGQCVAGMVGKRMPHYCLFGNTVNIASRMESSSLALRIQVSGDTAHILQRMGTYHLEQRGSIEVKGRGTMTTYWLKGCDGFNKPMPSLAEAADAEFHEFK